MKRSADILFCCVCTLLALGTVMVFSIISARGSTMGVGIHYLLKHLLWVGLALGGFFLARRIDYRLLQRYWWVIALGAGILLLAVLVPGIGTYKNGARRWIRLGPVGVQPSEIAKLGMIIVLSALAVRHSTRVKEFRRGFLPLVSVMGLTAVLVFAEHDFSTAALLGLLGALILIAAGVRLTPLLGAGLLGSGAMAFLISRSPTRSTRILAFLDPWKYADSAGYQPLHSLMALGSGGLIGRAGMQKVFWLPEADTDFILAIIGEELGLVGTLGILCIFLLIIRQAMKISEAAPDEFGRLVAFGISALIALQALIHIAVVTVSMPTTGIALPFVSSGGSGLLVSMAAIGILANIARQARATDTATEPKRAPMIGITWN